MVEVLILGELLVDMIALEEGELRDVETFGRFPGGAPANVAVGLARLGRRPYLISKVGDDPFGYFLIDKLREEGVLTRYIYTDPYHHTGLVFVQLRGAKPEFFLYSHVAYNYLTEDEVHRALSELGVPEVIHVGSVMLNMEPSRGTQLTLMRSMKGKSLLSMDVNVRLDLWRGREDELWEVLHESLEYADVVKMGDGELRMAWESLMGGTSADFEDMAMELSERYGLLLLVVTLGERGSMAVHRGKAYTARGFKVRDVVDTTGAGDAFTSALLSSLLEVKVDNLSEEDIAYMLQWSNLIASLSVTRRGAWSVPKIEEIRLECEKHLEEDDLKIASDLLRRL